MRDMFRVVISRFVLEGRYAKLYRRSNCVGSMGSIA